MPGKKRHFLLFIIVLSQFAGTSLWFVGNAVLPELSAKLQLTISLALVTSIVQIGFISGTLLFSVLAVADRFKATAVFFACCTLAAVFNLGLVWFSSDVYSLYLLRFLTGFFLAGIYPVGLKIAADVFDQKLGNALGFLVGALVLGTAFPHGVKSVSPLFSFQWVVIITSFCSILGGGLMYFLVPAGGTFKTQQRSYSSLFSLFKSKNFQSASVGYFGHMWELYAFWAFVPVAITYHNSIVSGALNVPFWSFFIIAAGAVGCVGGGLLSKTKGSEKVASFSLIFSGCCCLFSPFLISANTSVFLPFMLVWGLFVVADSPQFSALVARWAPPQNKGTALTFVTCVGFAITVVSIQALQFATARFGQFGFLILVVGPALGLFFMKRHKKGVTEESAV